MFPFQRKVMADMEGFISELLNFGADWTVDKIEVNHNFKEVDIYLIFNKKVGLFSETKIEFPIYDSTAFRRVRWPRKLQLQV